jgi:hypothetical protein
MTPSDAHTRISPKDLAELEDLAHHLSDFVTVLVYHASLLPPDLPAPLFERTLILTGLAAKIETHLIKLMYRLGELGDSPNQPIEGVGKPEERSKRMPRDEKRGKLAAEITLYNMFLTEAIFEILAERGILTGEEVKERVEKLKNEAPKEYRWMQ